MLVEQLEAVLDDQHEMARPGPARCVDHVAFEKGLVLERHDELGGAERGETEGETCGAGRALAFCTGNLLPLQVHEQRRRPERERGEHEADDRAAAQQPDQRGARGGAAEGRS